MKATSKIKKGVTDRAIRERLIECSWPTPSPDGWALAIKRLRKGQVVVVFNTHEQVHCIFARTNCTLEELS